MSLVWGFGQKNGLSNCIVLSIKSGGGSIMVCFRELLEVELIIELFIKLRLQKWQNMPIFFLKTCKCDETASQGEGECLNVPKILSFFLAVCSAALYLHFHTH